MTGLQSIESGDFIKIRREDSEETAIFMGASGASGIVRFIYDGVPGDNPSHIYLPGDYRADYEIEILDMDYVTGAIEEVSERLENSIREGLEGSEEDILRAGIDANKYRSAALFLDFLERGYDPLHAVKKSGTEPRTRTYVVEGIYRGPEIRTDTEGIILDDTLLLMTEELNSTTKRTEEFVGNLVNDMTRYNSGLNIEREIEDGLLMPLTHVNAFRVPEEMDDIPVEERVKSVSKEIGVMAKDLEE